ncbi:unnamed protein product, partial [Allacma fusca]
MFLRNSLPIEDSKFVEKLCCDLGDLISEAYNELLNLLQLKEEEAKSYFRQTKDAAAKEYSNAMQNLFLQNGQAPIEATLLDSYHEKEKFKAVQLLAECFQNTKKKCQGVDEEWLKNVTQELNIDIDQIYQAKLGQNQLRKDNYDSKAQLCLAAIKDNYMKEMKETIARITEEDELTSRQSVVKQESIDNLTKEVQNLVSFEVIQKLLEDLKSFMDNE